MSGNKNNIYKPLDGYVSKPIKVDELKETIIKLVK
jgi:hypothetical protein